MINVFVNREFRHDVSKDGKREKLPWNFNSFLVILNQIAQI